MGLEHAADPTADRLTEDQDDQQGKALRQVLDMQRKLVRAHGGQRRTEGVDGHRDAPEQLAEDVAGAIEMAQTTLLSPITAR